jgi:predicted glycoside hydrolase/deacetylase ChbG (UPF0249 family)
MPPRLIINADDFGLTPGINRAIAELHDAGALTSATLMANGPAFDDAVAIARARPSLGVGCHIVLTDGAPVAPSSEIPSLLDRKSTQPQLRRSLLDFHRAILTGRIRPQEIALEANAQIARLQSAGIRITHLDTHKHTHILPSVARILVEIAERMGIPAMRNPYEPGWATALSHASATRRLQVRILNRLRSRFHDLPQIRSGIVRTTGGTLGVSATGTLDEPTLRALLRHAPEGIWELVTHPGYNDRDLDAVTTRLRSTREVEYAALLAAFTSSSPESLNPSGLQLIHYGELIPVP